MMVDGVDFKLTGFDEVMKKFQKINDVKKQRKIGRRAARKALIPVRNTARNRAKQLDNPKTATAIYKNIAIVENTKASKKIGGIVMRVGVRGGARKGKDKKLGPGGDTWYWRLVEYGTVNTKANPILRGALEEHQDQVIETYNKEMSKLIDEAQK